MQNKELMTSISGIMIAGTSSGCGKTTITCAVLQLLVERGLRVSAFKCGPDYIDPMFHRKITGRDSCNLDSYLCNTDTVKYLYAQNSKQSHISVIEGVMGFYDGCKSGENKYVGSAYEMSGLIDVPVILIVNCRGMSSSVLAVIKGFYEFRKDNRIAGVILNHVTAHTYETLKLDIEEEFSNQIKVFGYMPALPEKLLMESRHLGLVKADEIDNFSVKMNELAEIAGKTIDIDSILNCAAKTESFHYTDIFPDEIHNGSNVKNHDHITTKCRIGIAMDAAFCFYYQDNLKLLELLGAELVYFSPLDDMGIPEGICGIYLGGGYPELYAKKLSLNIGMKTSIKKALKDGIPCIAECGGFMYLQNKLDGYDMTGFLKGNPVNKGKLQRFGYAEYTAKYDNLLCMKDDKIKGHEFHYYDSDYNGDGFHAQKLNGTNWDCIICDGNIFAGYPHLHFYSNLNAAKRFIEKCEYYGRNLCKKHSGE